MSPGSSIRISLKVNGRDHEFPATACDTLLDVLRDKLGMTGPRKAVTWELAVHAPCWRRAAG